MELPRAPTTEEIEEGRRLFSGSCDFFYGAQSVEQLPGVDRAEVAFAGRSNVGKSSIINALTNRRSLARASSEPGRTKQLNFFNLNGRLTLVDMPGYGFAKAAKAVKEDWQRTMFAYLRGRPTLERVVLLIDGRVGFKKSDCDVCDMLDKAAVVFQVVLTKCDYLSEDTLNTRISEADAVIKKHAAAFPRIIPTSSTTGQGIPELRAVMSHFASPAVSRL